ncbi:unnamed protein product, partial [Mesorhabditis belari]|uniref:E2F/DP family winged-helix DNA-binding domain-containing protein n=1 Tax=Mesorhabditis belari TaxID=2138241 RepID=A0AAF3FK47_9BILA
MNFQNSRSSSSNCYQPQQQRLLRTRNELGPLNAMYAQGELDVKRTGVIREIYQAPVAVNNPYVESSDSSLSRDEQNSLEQSYIYQDAITFGTQTPMKQEVRSPANSSEKARRRLAEALSTPSPSVSRKRAAIRGSLEGTQPKLSSRQEFLALASEQGSPLPRGCRADNSLLVLTQKFLDLLLTNQLVNLNEAADMLKVPKRRLYDITNVLDGIDMINKAGKNSISLKNPARARQMMNGNQMKSLQQRVVQREKRDALKVKGNDLDQIIASLEGAVKIAKESPVDRTYCYVRNEDLRRATGADDKTLIVVKLPFATHYDVTKSNFDETNRHSCLIRNREGYQVKVTLLPNPIEYQPPTDFAVPQLPSIPVKLEHEESSKNFPLLSDTTLTLSAAIPSVGTIEQFNYDHQEPCSSRSHNDEVVMPTPGILPDSSLALPLVTPSKLFSPGTSSFLISPLKTLLDSEQIQLTPGPFSFDDTSHLPLPLPHLTPRGTGATLDLLYDDSVWHFFDRNSQNGL